MNHAYNLRDSYSVAQTGTNLTDYGNAVGSSYDATGDYWYAVTANAGEAPVAGFFDVWGALTTNGSKFEWYDCGRTANYVAGTGADGDGSLAILQQNPASGYVRAGQDITDNIAVKVGQDDTGVVAFKMEHQVVIILLTLT